MNPTVASSAAVIEVVVANLVAGHRPVYALGEWAAPYDPAVLGLQGGDAEVPIAYRVADGNTPDDVTHIPT